MVAKWEEGYNRALEYARRNGDARIAFSYTVDGFKLGSWVNTQRTNHARGTLDPERAQRLGDLPGWTLGRPRRPRASSYGAITWAAGRGQRGHDGLTPAR